MSAQRVGFSILFSVVLFMFSLDAIGANAEKQSEILTSHIKKGEDFFFEREYVAAAREYEKARDLSPDNLEVRRCLSNAYFMAGDFGRALKERQSIIETDPARGDYYQLGIIYHGLGEDTKGIQALHQEATRFNTWGSNL